MRKKWQNHINASRSLIHHPKRLLKAGLWKPGKKTPNIKKKIGKGFKT